MANSELTIQRRMGYTWITFPDSISMDNIISIENKIEATLAQGQSDRVVVDLAGVEQLYSSGIGLLIRMRKRVAETGGYLCLVNVTTRLRRLLESAQLQKVFPMYATDVEFEISQDDVWAQKNCDEDVGLVYVAQNEKGVRRITISGQLTIIQNKEKLLALKKTLYDAAATKYVFDLSGLDIVDTYGAQQIEDLLGTIAKIGGKCAAYGANDVVRELIGLLGVDRLISICPTEREAIKAVSA
jgi:anti-anti-sigma factor